MEDNIAAAAGQDQPNQAAEPSEEIHVCRKPPRKKTYWGLWLLLILLMIAAAGIWLFYINDFQLSIRLKEDGEYLLEYGDSYQEPGMEAVLSGRWLLQNGYVLEEVPVQWKTDLQPDTLGKYTVNYTAEFYGWTASAQRTVRVVDTVCPVLTLIDTDYTVLPGNPYEEEGYLAVDNHDGNLTDKVKKSRKRDIITYTVWDSSGNPASAERKIPYLDPESPILVLEGGEYIRHTSGRFYTDPGYSAEDNVDGDLTEMVAIEGEVVWYRPGIYDIVYTIADAFGNVTQKIRTVEVVAEPQPEVVYPVGKTIYLTFDDGPGPYTGQLLDLLRQYGVKATFFVTDTGDKNGYLWRMHREGHSIGIHTMTHDYNSIYASPEAFFQDLYGMQDVIYRETGIKTTLMRFPGGGSNLVSNFNEGIMTTLTQAVQDAGFQYFDWNVDSNDAGGARTSAQVVANVTEGIQKQRHSIVLQHDIHDFSVEAVEEIILWGLNNGYQFLPLTPSSPTMHHEVLN